MLTKNAQPSAYSRDEQRVADALIAENYDLLLNVARTKRRRARVGDSLATVDLVHEGYLKLNQRPDWVSSEHFVRAMVLAMRHVIVDHARRRLAQKRGGGARRVDLDAAEPLFPEFSETPEQLVAIADLLGRLGDENERWLRVVDARYFGGMTEVETAAALGISERTVRRDWRDARAWLAREIGVAG